MFWTTHPAEPFNFIDVVLQDLGLRSLVKPIKLRDIIHRDIVIHTFHDPSTVSIYARK
jgi:hypothetical protein